MKRTRGRCGAEKLDAGGGGGGGDCREERRE